jgi:hypothetical protein
MSQPEPGVLCMAGTIKPGGWGGLILHLPTFNGDGSQILETFNADARGITKAAFTITSPPSQGLTVTGAITKRTDCQSVTDFCWIYGFVLMTAPDSWVPVLITAPGPTRADAPFANFRQTDRSQGDANQKFDTHGLQYLGLGLGPGAYDFCIRDFLLLDANGDEVKEVKPSP